MVFRKVGKKVFGMLVYLYFVLLLFFFRLLFAELNLSKTQQRQYQHGIYSGKPFNPAVMFNTESIERFNSLNIFQFPSKALHLNQSALKNVSQTETLFPAIDAVFYLIILAVVSRCLFI